MSKKREEEFTDLEARRELTHAILDTLPRLGRWYNGTATPADCRLAAERLDFAIKKYGVVFSNLPWMPEAPHEP